MPEDLPDFGRAENPIVRKRAVPEKISDKTDAPARPRRPRPPNPSERKPKIETGAENVFYPLTFARNSEEEDLRIIRAELSPSSLFALGVNLPVENETARIKADLLVGADGVARAIRFVK